MNSILLLIILIPAIEIYLLIKIGSAPLHKETVSKWVENKTLSPVFVPGNFTIKFPVSVGSGIFLLALSKNIQSSGTPYFINLFLTATKMNLPSLDAMSFYFLWWWFSPFTFVMGGARPRAKRPFELSTQFLGMLVLFLVKYCNRVSQNLKY